MKLVGRKIYLDIDDDLWLTEQFGPQRERSRAVGLAIRDFRLKVEANRKNIEASRIDLGRLK